VLGHKVVIIKMRKLAKKPLSMKALNLKVFLKKIISTYNVPISWLVPSR